MIRKVPIIGPAATIGQIACGIARSFDRSARSEFEAALSRHTLSRYVHLTDSGIAAFYVILKALAKGVSRNEVILPAYTAGSLVVAVRKAGLKVVLCDISLTDFNADTELLLGAVTDRTLAVAAVHMFGIGMSGVAGLRQRLPSDVVLIEDCCQAMGASIGGSPVGTFGDVAFFSFNRGKNMPVCGGGAIATNSEKISKTVSGLMERFSAPGAAAAFSTVFRTTAFSLAMHPYIYGCIHGMAARFKEIAPPKDFYPAEPTLFQCAVGSALSGRFETLAARRHDNGAYLIDGLRGVADVTLPSVAARDRAVFNRLPLLCKEVDVVVRAARQLWRAGIESSRMYIRPLHHMFDLGYARDAFPKSRYLADRLLTLPVHPSVKRKDLSKMVEVIRGACR